MCLVLVFVLLKIVQLFFFLSFVLGFVVLSRTLNPSASKKKMSYRLACLVDKSESSQKKPVGVC